MLRIDDQDLVKLLRRPQTVTRGKIDQAEPRSLLVSDPGCRGQDFIQIDFQDMLYGASLDFAGIVAPVV